MSECDLGKSREESTRAHRVATGFFRWYSTFQQLWVLLLVALGAFIAARFSNPEESVLGALLIAVIGPALAAEPISELWCGPGGLTVRTWTGRVRSFSWRWIRCVQVPLGLVYATHEVILHVRRKSLEERFVLTVARSRAREVVQELASWAPATLTVGVARGSVLAVLRIIVYGGGAALAGLAAAAVAGASRVLPVLTSLGAAVVISSLVRLATGRAPITVARGTLLPEKGHRVSRDWIRALTERQTGGP